MGSMIHLAVGRLEVDWGKNRGFQDHSALFQGESDVADVPYFYVGDEDETDFEDERKWKIIVEFKEGLRKPLVHIIERLNLLGHTYDQCKIEFSYLSVLHRFDEKKFSFRCLEQAIAGVDVLSLSADYSDGSEDFGKYFRREIAPRLGLEQKLKCNPSECHAISEAMENLSAYTVLHLLARNRTAASLPVHWAFDDVHNGGYARREDFVRELDPKDRFLIVTEGSSDATILRHALFLLRPHIADFFDFIDMQEGYPFSGTGNVFKFVQGLIGIRIQNKILVLFDNDAEGCANYNRCTALKVPENMRILKLPDLPKFSSFPTIGPTGSAKSDINGRAAAIECYLDLDNQAHVRWTSYNKIIEEYQGELDRKEHYMRSFLKQNNRYINYDYSGLEQILDVLIEKATSISESETSAEWRRFIDDPLT